MRKIDKLKVEYFALKIYNEFKGHEVKREEICLFALEQMRKDKDLFFRANKKNISVYIRYLMDNRYIDTVYDKNNVFIFKFRKRRAAIKNKKKTNKK